MLMVAEKSGHAPDRRAILRAKNAQNSECGFLQGLKVGPKVQTCLGVLCRGNNPTNESRNSAWGQCKAWN
jgi:hypothetical protein